MHRSEVPLQKYGQKRVFASFETVFTAFVVIFLPLCMVFYVDLRYRCQHTGINVCSLALKQFLRHSPYFLSHYRLFCVDQRYFCQDTGENVCSPGFETGFTVFAVLFLALLRLFCIYQRYCCQDTGENVCSPDLKPFLWCSPFFF